MKPQLSYHLLLITVAMLFSACSKDVDPGTKPVTPTPPVEKSNIAMKIYTVLDADNIDHPSPRIVAEWGEHMVAQVNNPLDSRMMMFQYVNSHASCDGAVLISDHNVIFIHYNPLTDEHFPSEALIAGDYDNFSTISLCNIDWETDKIDLWESAPLPNKKASRLRSMTLHGENDNLKQPFFDMLDEISSGIAEIQGTVEKFGPAGNAAVALCQAWTTVLIPIMQYQLYADDAIGQQEYIEDLFYSQVMNVVETATGAHVEKLKDTSIGYLCDITGVKQDDVNMALWAYDQLQRVKDKTNPSRVIDRAQYNEKGLQAAIRYADNAGKADAVINKPQQPQAASPVNVAVTVGDVTSTSISLSGRVGFESSMYASAVAAGYIYYEGSVEHRVPTGVDEAFNIKPATIKDLKPNTTYMVAAYYESLASSRTFISPAVTVKTRAGETSNQWEGTKWIFSGNLTTIDSDEGTTSGSITFGLDLTDLSNWALAGFEDPHIAPGATIGYEIMPNGDLVLTASGTMSTTEESYWDTSTYKHTMILSRVSSTKATLKWDGTHSGQWYDNILQSGASYSTTFIGTFDGTLTE